MFEDIIETRTTKGNSTTTCPACGSYKIVKEDTTIAILKECRCEMCNTKWSMVCNIYIQIQNYS